MDEIFGRFAERKNFFLRPPATRHPKSRQEERCRHDLDEVPPPDAGPPASFVTAVETALRTAEAEAKERLNRLIAMAERSADAERESALRRLARWLRQSKADAAEQRRALDAESALHDRVAEALHGARLELDQAAIVQLL